MEVPPPSSEDNDSAGHGSEAAASAPKKRTRTRSRLYRSKSAKSADSGAAEDKVAASAPEPAPVAPAPVERAPEPVAQPAPEARSSSPLPAGSGPLGEAAGAGGEPRGGSGPQPGGGEAQGGADGQGQGYEGEGGGQPFQHGGGGKFGRWRDKKFRGGGKWNKHQNGGGGGGGGGGAPKYPPQPPPPKGEIQYGDLPDPARYQDFNALQKLADEIAVKRDAPIWLNELYALSMAELTAKARELGARLEGVPSRKQLLAAIFAGASEQKILILDHGWLDLTDRGHGFIVHSNVNYRLYPEDAYLPEGFVHKYGLKRGHEVEVQVQAPQGNDRCPAVLRINQVMGGDPDIIAAVKPFEELTPYYPLQRIWLEQAGAKDVSMRMVDIITPVGFGQRGLIVAPPRTGKTILLQNIANSVAANSPDARLIILLVDERPEEVTDFRRHCKGEVISSTFDETPESHVHCAEMVIEKARRLVEKGE
ncbi:MAG: transcription termination factor Rho, partial [Opitutales bacterium]